MIPISIKWGDGKLAASLHIQPLIDSLTKPGDRLTLPESNFLPCWRIIPFALENDHGNDPIAARSQRPHGSAILQYPLSAS
ncbi:hypothetical protein LDFHOB_09050 [Candidatus Electronema aureum]